MYTCILVDVYTCVYVCIYIRVMFVCVYEYVTLRRLTCLESRIRRHVCEILQKTSLGKNENIANLSVLTVPLPLGASEIDVSVLSCPPSISNRHCSPLFFTLPISKRPRRFLAAAPSFVSSAPPRLKIRPARRCSHLGHTLKR
jgi:hypothetical protein